MLQKKTILSFLISLLIICNSCSKVNLISLPPLPSESHIQTKRDINLYIDSIEFRGLDEKYNYQETEALLLRYINNARYFKQVFSSSTVQRPNDGKHIILKAIITPQEEHTFNWWLSWPAIYPITAYWPLQYKRGSASVRIQCNFYDNNGKQLTTLNTSHGEKYYETFYGFFRKGTAKRTLKKCYEKVFEQISLKIAGIDKTFVQALKQIEKPSYLAEIKDDHIEGLDNPKFKTNSMEIELKDIQAGQFHALLIGNNQYKFLPNLKSAVNDISQIAQVLENDYGFKVKLMINSSRSEIISALGELRQRLTETDNVLIYYAGHGWLDEAADEGYWLPSDATKENEANWISNSAITSSIKAM